MDATRWQWIQTLFHDAAGRPESERHAFLLKACAGDEEAVSDVMLMLKEDSRNTSLLDGDMGRLAQTAFGDNASTVVRSIGPYRILKLLGEGGMGVVYLAEREDLGSLVAIKILPNAWMSPARSERFALEERALSRLNHPAIARLYDAGTLDDGTPWFAMEYVEGLPLTEYCESVEASLEQRLRLFRSVCEAVQYAHGQAILHRDLKPSNIFVRPGGEVRLLDFGIAKQLDPAESGIDLTRTGLRLATPAYAAPEQLRGEPAAVQADVYSLGVILYELVTGRLPFDFRDQSQAEAAAALVDGQPEKPSLATRKTIPQGRSLWADLDVLCLTAIHKDVRKRYQSVEALIRDIDHFLKNEPLDARPDTVGYKLGKFVGRNRRPLAAAALVLTALAGILVWFTLRLADARDAALAEAARTQRIQQFTMGLLDGGDEKVGPAEDLRVVTLIDRSAREIEALSADPEMQADMYHTLSNVYQNLGKLDRAEELIKTALEKRKQGSDSNKSRLSESLAFFGMLRAHQGRLEESEKLVREAVDHAKKTLPASHPVIAAAITDLGRVLVERGQYEEAIRVLEEALRLQPRSAVPTQAMANVLIRLASAHFYSGRYDDSEPLNRRVLEMYRRMYGERHPLLADPLINLGAIAYGRARYGEAERYYRDASDVMQSYYGRGHMETAASMQGIGKALVSQKRFDEAEPLLKQVLAIQERVFGVVHSYNATTLMSLGHIAMETGKLDLAEAHFRKAANIYRATRGDSHQFVATALGNVGTVHLRRKDYRSAEEMLRDAVERYSKTLPEDHRDIGIARVKLGRALLGQRRYQEAERESLAGLRITEKVAGPASTLVTAAREDLAKIYEALNQPQQAAAFRPPGAK